MHARVQRFCYLWSLKISAGLLCGLGTCIDRIPPGVLQCLQDCQP
jgi:hypothetical protein